MSKDRSYLPNERDYLESEPKIIKSYSKDKKDYTKLPDNVRDPIVANNIATWEFDNTSKDIQKNNNLIKD